MNRFLYECIECGRVADFMPSCELPECRHRQIPRETAARRTRRELAEKILLEMIRISPQVGFATFDTNHYGEGIKLAWETADAFLKAEPDT